jgi:hypothetical protein
MTSSSNGWYSEKYLGASAFFYDYLSDSVVFFSFSSSLFFFSRESFAFFL